MKNRGFIMPSILVLLLLASMVSVNALRLRALADATHVKAQLSSQAYYAARSALHWTMAEIDLAQNLACPTTSVLDGVELGAEGFNVTLSCSATEHTDAGQSITIFYLTADASYQSFGHRHFTSRHIELTYLK